MREASPGWWTCAGGWSARLLVFPRGTTAAVDQAGLAGTLHNSRLRRPTKLGDVVGNRPCPFIAIPHSNTTMADDAISQTTIIPVRRATVPNSLLRVVSVVLDNDGAQLVSPQEVLEAYLAAAPHELKPGEDVILAANDVAYRQGTPAATALQRLDDLMAHGAPLVIVRDASRRDHVRNLRLDTMTPEEAHALRQERTAAAMQYSVAYGGGAARRRRGAMSAWRTHLDHVYDAMKARDPSATYKHAMVEASRSYRR